MGGGCYLYEKASDARLFLGFLKTSRFAQNLLFLTFGAHFLCLINSMCFFSFPSSLKTEADPLRLWRSYHLSILQAIKFSNLKFLLFPSYIIPICMTSYIKRISFLFLSFHTFFPCSQSFASFYFVLCFFYVFLFPCFIAIGNFPALTSLLSVDDLTGSPIIPLIPHEAGEQENSPENSNWEMLWKNTEIDLENTVKDTVEKCS